MNKIETLGLSTLSGLITTLIFQMRYALIDNQLYELRDDGVITMSVGRHIVEYGFVGVSPSGPIVEASSSPVQMFAYAGAYVLASISPHAFALIQTLIGSFVIGAVLPLLFRSSVRLSLFSVALLSLLLTFVYPFFLWHGSGMENALTHALLMTSVAGLVHMMSSGRLSMLWAIPLILTCFVRLELIITVISLLSVFCLAWWLAYRRFEGLFLLFLVLSACIAIHWCRFHYFGALFPNTAVAQNISPVDRLVATLKGHYWPVQHGLIVTRHNVEQGGWWLGLLSLPFALWFARTASDRMLIALTCTVLAVAIVAPILLGFPRIDWGRTYSHVAPVALLLPVFCIIRGLEVAHLAQRLVVLACASGAVGLILQGQPYYLGWKIGPFDTVRQNFLQLASENDIGRPLVANPDLGIMTWSKEVNVLDLGMLGSPVVAQLQGDPGFSDYVLDFARPDFIETHKYWTVLYCESLYLDPRFITIYEPLEPTVNIAELCQDESSQMIYWMRTDIMRDSSSSERAFIREMQTDLSFETVQTEMAACEARNEDCTYITRTVFRYIPELIETGHFDDVLTVFNSELDRDYLTGWRDPSAAGRISAHFSMPSP